MINWRKGLFRLWVVVSILWVGAVTPIMWRDLQNSVEQIHWHYFGQWRFDRILVPLPLKALDECKHVARAFSESDHAWILLEQFRECYPQYSDIPDRELSKRLYEKYHAAVPAAAAQAMAGRQKQTDVWLRFAVSLSAIAAPPVLCLLLGVSCFWVARGFRR